MLAAIPPVNVAKKNFLRVHLSIEKPLHMRGQTQIIREARFGSHALLWLETDAAPKLRAVVDRAIGNDKFNFANVVNGFERIPIENNQVSALTFFDRADFLINTHHTRRHNRRGLNRFHGCESGLDVQLDLAVQAVPWNRLVRSGDDRNSSLVQCANPQSSFANTFSVKLRIG